MEVKKMFEVTLTEDEIKSLIVQHVREQGYDCSIRQVSFISEKKSITDENGTRIIKEVLKLDGCKVFSCGVLPSAHLMGVVE